MRTKYKLYILVAAAPCLLFMSGCSSGVQTASALETSAKPSRTAKPKTESNLAEAETTPKSVFTVDKNSRDPFFPQAKPSQAEESTTPELAIDVPTLLQANLHGIVSAGGKSIAYIANVMLEEGRNAVIPIRAGGRERQVAVRCREVTKDTVVLEVQGHPEPVRISRVGQ